MGGGWGRWVSMGVGGHKRTPRALLKSGGGWMGERWDRRPKTKAHTFAAGVGAPPPAAIHLLH